MPRPSTSAIPARASKLPHAKLRHHRTQSVLASRPRRCVTVQVDVGHSVSPRATPRGDTDLISGLLPLVVHPLSLLPKKNRSLHQRRRPGGRRLVLLSSLHNCFGCAIDSSLLLLFVCHASHQKQIMSQAYYQVCNTTQSTTRFDEEYIDKDVVHKS